MMLKHVSALQAGDRLAKPIYTERGLILLNANQQLTDGMIKRLRIYGIQYVYIRDPRLEDILVTESITDETRHRAIEAVYETFQEITVTKKWNSVIAFSKLGTRFRQIFEDILLDLQTHKQVLLQLSNLYLTNRHLYTHSVHTAIYAAALGMALGFSYEELMELGIGALLHDIGITQIRPGIIEKPSKLTPEEFAEVQEHTEIGFEMLRNIPDIPLLSAHCAYQHHERLDGSGYPRKLKGDEIHLYAKIVGLVDTYVALISNRPYRNGYLPHEALEMLFASGNQFDPNLIDTFRNHIMIYPIGTIVTLSTGDKGVVVDVNSSYPSRPIVRVLKNPKNESVTPFELDLSSHLSITIQACEPTL
jgi:HD-GYP domain-containing protein (c-di-GMP phosphodiesterase class II)